MIDKATFLAKCEAEGLPEPEPEFRFCPHRKWKFDWYFGESVALEIEGGAFYGPGHRSVGKFLRDMEKYNEASTLGFRVIRCTTQDIERGTAILMVRRALDAARGLDVGPPPFAKRKRKNV